MSERKPCPFCGSSNATLDYYEISGPEELGTIVVCNDCGASAKSIVDWNTRPIEDALRARIAELEAAQRWIPVSERLPEEDTDGNALMAICRYSGEWVRTAFGAEFADEFVRHYTHWMPLPELPEVQQ